MQVKLNFEPGINRALLIFSAGLLGGLLASFALMRFTVNVVADATIDASREVIEAATNYFPNAPALHARLAASLIETRVDEGQSHEQVAELASLHAWRAVQLAPQVFENYVLLAVAAELKGDLPTAETAMQRAVQLAPRRPSLQWRLGNLWLRSGKLDEATTMLGQVVQTNPSYLPEALGLLWQTTAGDVARLQNLVGPAVNSQLELCRFLLTQEQYEGAAKIFAALPLNAESAGGDRAKLQTERNLRSQILSQLLSAGKSAVAASLWQQAFAKTGEWGVGKMWNGDFERPIQKEFTQFDWNLTGTNRVRVAITAEAAHSGRQALKLQYLGKETTKLDREIFQFVPVQAGQRYELEFFARTETLVSPDGPFVTVLVANVPTPLAVSNLMPTGTNDWRAYQLNFTVPTDVNAVTIAVKQTPKFSYTEPTKGTVWFDDFRLNTR